MDRLQECVTVDANAFTATQGQDVFTAGALPPLSYDYMEARDCTRGPLSLQLTSHLLACCQTTIYWVHGHIDSRHNPHSELRHCRQLYTRASDVWTGRMRWTYEVICHGAGTQHMLWHGQWLRQLCARSSQKT